MLDSLRSRLFWSYLAVIATALVIVAAFLFLLSLIFSRAARIEPALLQLRAIGQGVRQSAERLREAGSDLAALQAYLDETAAANGIRIAVFDQESRQVIYDTRDGQPWLGLAFEANALRRLDLPAASGGAQTDRQQFYGRFAAPDRTSWLVVTQPVADRQWGRLVLVFARQEESAWQFFRQTFLPPLAGAGLMALLLSMLLAWLISRSVARPLQDLAGATAAVAEGDYSTRLAPRGPAEVRRVAASFNSMAAHVAATQQAQRDFVANVSHDLKTPLTSIQGWSQSLLDGTADSPEQQRRAAATIYGEAERMARMVGQLLDLARIESGTLALRREPVELGLLLADVRRNMTVLAQSRQVELQLSATAVPSISGDYDRLMQLFSNLVENGLNHTPPGGEVRLRLQPAEDGRQVEVSVADNGPGIPPEELGRIFERFYQVDKSRRRGDGRSGSGLGLAIARELAEAHGGSLRAESIVGLGSRFVVQLPAGER